MLKFKRVAIAATVLVVGLGALADSGGAGAMKLPPPVTSDPAPPPCTTAESAFRQGCTPVPRETEVPPITNVPPVTEAPRPHGVVRNAVTDWVGGSAPGAVRVSWDAPTDLGVPAATFYWVRGLKTIGQPLTAVVAVSQTSVVFTSGLGDGKTDPQSYSIYACHGAVPQWYELGPLTDCGAGTPAYLPLYRNPEFLQATEVNPSAVTLEWSQGNGGLYIPVTYRIQMDGGETRIVPPIPGGTPPTFMWTGLRAESTHTFRVQACYPRLCTGFLSPVTVTTPAWPV
jgi:hypothetical protein